MESEKLKTLRGEVEAKVDALQGELDGLSFTPDYSSAAALGRSGRDYLDSREQLISEIESYKISMPALNAAIETALQREAEAKQDSRRAELDRQIKKAMSKFSKTKQCSVEQSKALIELSYLMEEFKNVR